MKTIEQVKQFIINKMNFHLANEFHRETGGDRDKFKKQACKEILDFIDAEEAP